ncbi:MAG: hypothetical protein WCQ82_03780 [Bacteroidaceae bacterium]
MYILQTNEKGSRSIDVTVKHLETIKKYALFKQLVDSSGIIDESVLDKLKLNIRSLIAIQESNSADLLDLCIDVVYHNNMKAYGLNELLQLYISWNKEEEAKTEEDQSLS